MVNKLVPNGISKDIEKGFQVIYSLHDVFIWKEHSYTAGGNIN
jgi:hypothetical protein